MYETYWQLARKPFEPTAQQESYYPSETHQGAMLKLRYAVENRRGAALLTGPAGTGKTMLVQTLRRQLPESFAPFVHVVFPEMAPAELISYIADELGAPATSAGGKSLDQTVRRIEHFLDENTGAGGHAVLAVDEAHLLAAHRTLETMRLLLNFELAGRPGLTLVLAGQPSLLPALLRQPNLDERLAVKILLRALTVEETASYITHRLTAAGAQRQIFAMPAMEAVHELSRGIPRQINRLCDLALLIGYAEELPEITRDHIEAVSEELVTISATGVGKAG